MLGDIVVLLGVAAATDPAPGLGVGAGVLHVAAAPGAEALGLELAGAHLHQWILQSFKLLQVIFTPVSHLVERAERVVAIPDSSGEPGLAHSTGPPSSSPGPLPLAPSLAPILGPPLATPLTPPLVSPQLGLVTAPMSDRWLPGVPHDNTHVPCEVHGPLVRHSPFLVAARCELDVKTLFENAIMTSLASLTPLLFTQ